MRTDASHRCGRETFPGRGLRRFNTDDDDDAMKATRPPRRKCKGKPHSDVRGESYECAVTVCVFVCVCLLMKLQMIRTERACECGCLPCVCDQGDDAGASHKCEAIVCIHGLLWLDRVAFGVHAFSNPLRSARVLRAADKEHSYRFRLVRTCIFMIVVRPRARLLNVYEAVWRASTSAPSTTQRGGEHSRSADWRTKPSLLCTTFH